MFIRHTDGRHTVTSFESVPTDDAHLDLEWSEWLPLDPDRGALSSLPSDAGLYRVRHPEFDRLVYIGETGRSTRGRVRALARGAFADEMPFRDPHTAAPTLWAIRAEYGPDFEFAFATPPAAESKQSRKAIEAALIALHRRDTNRSPVANFGRMIPGYSQSSYSRDSRRGGPLEDGEHEPNTESGIAALPWTNYEDPLADDWMGIDWSSPIVLDDVHGSVPETGGVYRLWDNGPELVYIGQSANLKSRLYTHRRERREGLSVSFAQISRATAAHECLEIETELLGAYWVSMGAAPEDQF
jgi:hypothetical protein